MPAIASSYVQEQAYNLGPPPNGRKLHNMIQGPNHLYDYILSFYHLSALDFIDITAILQYTGNDEQMNGVKSWVKAQLASPGAFPGAPFLPRLNGPYIKDNAVNTNAIRNYVKAWTSR